MGKKNDSTTLRINYAYTPYDHLIDPDRIKARAKLMEKVGEELGDGGSFLLSLENQEEPFKDTDLILGRWVCRIEELDEVTEE
jgi:hypothetical protein